MSEPAAPTGPGGLPILRFPDAEAFERWLSANLDSKGLWLQLAKKGSGETTVSYPEAVEVALCLGWIDGQARSLDERFYLQRFTQRRAKSKWSQINVAKVEALIAAGRMQAPGYAQIEAAKRDGRWDAAYPSPKQATLPDDLRDALVAADALAAYEALDGQTRYAILYRLHDAKKPETRARRIATFVAKLAPGSEEPG